MVETRIQAETVVELLQAAGFSARETLVLLPDNRGTKAFAHEHHTKAPARPRAPGPVA